MRISLFRSRYGAQAFRAHGTRQAGIEWQGFPLQARRQQFAAQHGTGAWPVGQAGREDGAERGAGGVEGLIHMTEASHDRSAKLTDLFRTGAEIDVKVMKIDDKGKLWLSHKATTADPWDAVKEKYSVGSRHKGKVALRASCTGREGH